MIRGCFCVRKRKREWDENGDAGESCERHYLTVQKKARDEQ